MRIIRYSTTGFHPQKQTHHAEHIRYDLSEEFKLEDYPEFMRLEVKQSHENKVSFYTEHLEDFKRGIWCFIDGHKSNLALNHLKKKVPCWEAEIPNDTSCYDCNWEKSTVISDPILQSGGCYIPERELWKLTNVKRRKSR